MSDEKTQAAIAAARADLARGAEVAADYARNLAEDFASTLEAFDAAIEELDIVQANDLCKALAYDWDCPQLAGLFALSAAARAILESRRPFNGRMARL